MKCVICHGEDIQTKEVNEEIRVDNNIVYFLITIPVCQACGERYYDRKAMRLIEQVKQKLISEKLNLKETGKILRYSIENSEEKLIA
jgi:YgiT-type zinc finger domain-containing protein